SSSLFSESRTHLPLPSFPTRRSSDLIQPAPLQPPLQLRAVFYHRFQFIPAWLCATGADALAAAQRSFKQGFGQCAVNAQAQLQRSEEHTSELQSRENLVCRLLLEKKK